MSYIFLLAVSLYICCKIKARRHKDRQAFSARLGNSHQKDFDLKRLVLLHQQANRERTIVTQEQYKDKRAAKLCLCAVEIHIHRLQYKCSVLNSAI